MTRFLALLLLASTLLPLSAHAKKAIILPQVKEGDIIKAEYCEGFVLATLNGAQYNLPRVTSMEFRPTETTVIDLTKNEHPSLDCDIKDMGEVVSFDTGFYTKDDVNIVLSAPGVKTKEGYAVKANYVRFRDTILTAEKDGAALPFESGMKKYGAGNSQLYTLPRDTSPTNNGDPVVVRCLLDQPGSKNGMCNASYTMPNGEFLSYTFSKIYFPEETYPKLDQEVRQRLEKLKVKGLTR